MKNIQLLFLAVVVLFSATSCLKTVSPISAFAKNEVIYMDNDLDGSITLRVQGEGRDEEEAIDQAARIALYEVIFKGVEVPNNPRLSKPLVEDPQAEAQHEKFFNKFFKKGGKYTQFVSAKEYGTRHNYKKSRTTRMHVTSTVRVERSKLKNFLIRKEIINE